MAKSATRRQKQKPKPDDWFILASCDGLIAACRGVFAIEGDTAPADAERSQMMSLNPEDEDGEWTKFDPQLGEALGLEGSPRATDVVRALYPTDLDLQAAVKALTEWSGVSDEADQDFFES